VAKNDVGNRDRPAAASMAQPEPARRRAIRTETARAALIQISKISEIGEPSGSARNQGAAHGL
jgi:hypothetical protein